MRSCQQLFHLETNPPDKPPSGVEMGGTWTTVPVQFIKCYIHDNLNIYVQLLCIMLGVYFAVSSKQNRVFQNSLS